MRRQPYVFAPHHNRRMRVGSWLIALLFFFAIVSTIFFVNLSINTRVALRTDSVRILGLPKDLEGFKVLHISDLHASSLGSRMEIWKELLYGKNYHAVVMTGNMIGKSGEYEPFVSLVHSLSQINPNAPIFFIEGDEDPEAIVSQYHGSQDVLSEWVRAGEKAGGIYLDKPMSVKKGKHTAWFVPEFLYGVDAQGMARSLSAQLADMESKGLPYEASSATEYRALHYRLTNMEHTKAVIDGLTGDELQIAVMHAPADINYIRNSLSWAKEAELFGYRNIDLLLAGYYCAGQWRLPGGKALYMPEKGFFPPDEGLVGMQRINSLNVHISGGLGASGSHPLPGRLFNAPSVTLLTFTGRLK